MTPIEAAEHEMEERGFVCDTADARAIIAAFLEAASRSRDARRTVAVAVCLGDEGAKKAILALKEALE